MEASVLVQSLWYGLVNGAAYVLFASGLALAFGVMNVINLSHGELYMLGAMGQYYLMTYAGINYYFALILVVVGLAAFGIVVNRIAIQPVFRVSPLATLLSTLALSLVLLYSSFSAFTAHAKLIPAPVTGIIRIGGVGISGIALMIVTVSALTTLALHLFLAKTTLGKQMRATVQNLAGANLVGVNTKRIYDVTLMIAAGLAAVSGILHGTLYSAAPAMGQSILVIGFVIVIVAGMGNLLGTAIVGIIVGLVESLFVTYGLPQYRGAFIYLILIIIVLFRPQGLFATRGG